MNSPTGAPGPELFVYYRVAESAAEAACSAAVAMQAKLCTAYPGLQARLLRRPEAADGRCTLMETYSCGAGGGVGSVLQSVIAQAATTAMAGWQLGERHTEVFLPCA